MINKVFYFIASPLDSRDVERFGFEILQHNGIDVEVWDFTAIVNPMRLTYTPPDQCNFNKCRLFDRNDAVNSAIKNLPVGSFVVCILTYEYRSYCVFRSLSKHRIPYGLYFYSHPFHISTKSTIKRILNITPAKLATYLFNTLPLKYFGLRPASVVLALGGVITIPTFAMNKETKILWSHIFDYEIYLNIMKQSIKLDKKQVVFLDQYFPFHPDDPIGNHIISAEDYYPRLCRFFDYLEKKYGIHIVIAAHPRSQYETKTCLYGSRTITRGRTAELVSASWFVILHDSTSVSYPVLFKKPMLFITTDLLQKARMGVTEQVAGLFNKRVLNIDQSYEFDENSELTVSDKLYEEYINKYIKKSGEDDTPAWQKFADYLKKQNEIGRTKKHG